MELRHNPTEAEARAWELLRGRRLMGLKFRRQQIIQGYIVDFYCAERRLALEIDGGVHQAQLEADKEREAALARIGVRVVRIPNAEVCEEVLCGLLVGRGPVTPPRA